MTTTNELAESTPLILTVKRNTEPSQKCLIFVKCYICYWALNVSFIHYSQQNEINAFFISNIELRKIGSGLH